MTMNPSDSVSPVRPPSLPIAEYICADEAATRACAASLAHVAQKGDCLLLVGDLGAGKTAFARGFIHALCGAVEVTSPTFTLVQHYDPAQYHAAGAVASAHTPQIWHYDLYRIESAEELRELALEEALDAGIALIEWPQIAQNMLPRDALEIRIEPAGDSSLRRIALYGNERWFARVRCEAGDSREFIDKGLK